jgi:hypothetical protein
MGRQNLFITTDEMRHDSLGCDGGKVARTPVIDTLVTLYGNMAEDGQPKLLVEAPA